MTVKELRQLLFELEDQYAVVVVVTPSDIENGRVKKTHEVVARRVANHAAGTRLVLGHADDPQGFVSILTS